MIRRLVSVFAALTSLVALPAGCALPVEQQPRIVPEDRVPFGLSGAAQVDAPVFDRSLELYPVTVFLAAVTASGERTLVPRQRMIADPVNLATVVGNLMAGGITPEEREDRKSTRLNSSH